MLKVAVLLTSIFISTTPLLGLPRLFHTAQWGPAQSVPVSPSEHRLLLQDLPTAPQHKSTCQFMACSWFCGYMQSIHNPGFLPEPQLIIWSHFCRQVRRNGCCCLTKRPLEDYTTKIRFICPLCSFSPCFKAQRWTVYPCTHLERCPYLEYIQAEWDQHLAAVTLPPEP